MFWSGYWTMKSTIVVVPPQAAARVPVSNVSDAFAPPNGISMWVCASTPPGITYFPPASITLSTFCSRSKPSRVEPGASTAAMVSPSMSTSAEAVPVAFTTVPFLIRVFMAVVAVRSGGGDGGVGVGAAVPVELPLIAHLADHVEVEIADDDLLVLAAAELPDVVAARVHELAAAVERHGLVAVLVVLPADPVGGGDEVAVRGRRGGLLDLPEAVRQARLGRVRGEHDLRAVQAQLAPPLGEVPVVADVDADRPDRGLEDGVAEVAGAEVELLPELLEVRDVVLAVLAEDGAVGIHHDGGVVVDPRLVLLVDREDHHHLQLLRELREALHRGAVGRLGVVVVLGVLGDAEVGAVEELLEADDLRTLLRCLPREALVLRDHRLLVAGPSGLGDRGSDDGHEFLSVDADPNRLAAS